MSVINPAENFSNAFFHSCHAVPLLNVSNLFAGQMEQLCSIFFLSQTAALFNIWKFYAK